MTLPRQVLPGQTYLFTRRCVERRFLLLPEPEVTQTLLYCLGLAAERWGVEVAALCALANHVLCAAAHKTCYVELGVMRSRRVEAASLAEFEVRRCT